MLRHAIVVFTKVPEEGKVKTRLTEERGGILTPHEASLFYEASLMDIIDVCTTISNAKVWICHDSEGDRDYLNLLIAQLNNGNRISGIFKDCGGSFDECMQFAADFLFKSGNSREKLAESVIIVGGDVPVIQPGVLIDTIYKLEMLSQTDVGRQTAIPGSDIGAALVESPDQEGGFNIVGYTCGTPFNFQDVFYNMNGVTTLDMLAEKARCSGIPLLPVEMVPDVDLPVDLASLLPMLNVMEQAANFDPRIIIPRRTIKFLRDMGLQAFANPA